VGLLQDCLVYVSALADRVVKNPLYIVNLGDIVKVRVLEVDIERQRISLTMRSDTPAANDGSQPAKDGKPTRRNERGGKQRARKGAAPAQERKGTFAALFELAQQEKDGKKRL